MEIRARVFRPRRARDSPVFNDLQHRVIHYRTSHAIRPIRLAILLFALTRAAKVLRMLLTIHVAAGGLALVLGSVALVVKKGGTVHRRCGLLFVGAMLVMGGTASILALLKGSTDATGNVIAGVITAYFVGTAWMTVRPKSSWTRRINAVALALVVVLALGAIAGGVTNVNAPGLTPGGVSRRTVGVMSLVFGAAMTLAAIGDFRMLRSGGLRGGPRLARHLWRMCFALFIAAGSFFSLRERVATVLPEPFTTGPMRALPILLLFGAMFYWLWRVRSRRPSPAIVQRDSFPLAARAK